MYEGQEAFVPRWRCFFKPWGMCSSTVFFSVCTGNKGLPALVKKAFFEKLSPVHLYQPVFQFLVKS